MDDDVDVGLSDGALDEGDSEYDDFDVGELDRADETDQQPDPSDRRLRCSKGWKRVRKCYRYRRICHWRCVPQGTKSTTGYLVLGGTRYTVTNPRKMWYRKG